MRPIMHAIAATEKYPDRRHQTMRTPSNRYFSEPSHSDSVSHLRDFQRDRSCKAATKLINVPQNASTRVAVLKCGETMRRQHGGSKEGLVLCGKETKPSHSPDDRMRFRLRVNIAGAAASAHRSANLPILLTPASLSG